MINYLKIGPIYYAVSQEQDLHTHNQEWRKMFLEGHIEHSPSTIKVDENASPQKKNVILMHEAVHGVLEVAGIESDEKTVLALGYGLVALIQDNPDFIRQIWTVEEEAKKANSR